MARLAHTLPRALWQLGRQIDAAAAPAIVLAGAGAAWPFAAAIASEVGAVETLASPDLAVARGAAWWPQVGELLFQDRAARPEATAPPPLAPAAVALGNPPASGLALEPQPTLPPAIAPGPDLADLAQLERLLGSPGETGDPQ